MNKTRLASAVSHAMLASTLSGVALAQEEPGAYRGLEQVIVSARRVEENVQDVPLAITAMSAADLEKRGAATLQDLVQRAPAIQFQNATGRAEASVFGIRGQKADDILLTSDQAVAVIIGGVPMNWSYGVGLTGMLDAASAEVAKGPQGTLFGKNSTGGAIIITPAEPEQAVSGRVKAGIGNYNLRSLEGMYNTPLTDTLALRIAAQGLQRDGIIENLDDTGDDFQSRDNWASRISLKWSPTADLYSLLVVEASASSTSGIGGKLIEINTANPTEAALGARYAGAYAQVESEGFWESHSDAPHGGYNDLKSWGVLNTTSYDVSDNVTLKNIAGFRKFDYEGMADLDAVHRSMVQGNLKFQSNQLSGGQSITEELQIIGSYDLADWIAGLYYADTDGYDGARSVQFKPRNDTALTGPLGGVTNRTIAAFGQSTWHITDVWNVTTGLRATKDDREVVYNSQQVANPEPGGWAYACLLSMPVAGGTAVPEPCSQQKSRSFHKVTFNLSSDYKLSDDLMVYGEIRSGYRSGGFPGRGTNEYSQRSFDPETVLDKEIGLKLDSDVAGMPLRLNAAVFHQDYKDIQRNSTEVDPATSQLLNRVVNAARGTVWGGEVEFTLLPVDSLELSGFVSYIDASYDAWDDKNAANDPALRGTPIDRSANLFQSVPEKSASLTARYTLPLPVEVGEVSVAANVYWQSEMALYVDNKADSKGLDAHGIQDAYKIYNASIDWADVLGVTGLGLSAWGKNLANEKYFVSGLIFYNTTGINMGYQGEPRTYGMTVSYSFN